MPGRKPTLVNVDGDVMTLDEATPKVAERLNIPERLRNLGIKHQQLLDFVQQCGFPKEDMPRLHKLIHGAVGRYKLSRDIEELYLIDEIIKTWEKTAEKIIKERGVER